MESQEEVAAFKDYVPSETPAAAAAAGAPSPAPSAGTDAKDYPEHVQGIYLQKCVSI